MYVTRSVYLYISYNIFEFDIFSILIVVYASRIPLMNQDKLICVVVILKFAIYSVIICIRTIVYL